MQDEIFQECLKRKQHANGQPFWEELAQKYGFGNKDKLRIEFNRASKKARINGMNGDKFSGCTGYGY